MTRRAHKDEIKVQTEGWNSFLERQIPLRWPPASVHWFPEDGQYTLTWHWRFFQYVFPLRDPRALAPLERAKWTGDERAVFRRYLSHSSDLASASALTAPSGYTVRVPTPGAAPEITQENEVARDAVVGFLTMFRQFYVRDEAASFLRVHGLLSREAKRLGQELQALKEWRAAHAKLRHTHLDHLILVKAASEGRVPESLAASNASHPDQADSPEQMISALFYGDSIHWGEKRSVIEDWSNESPIFAVKRPFDALRATVQLGHLYIGFCAVVGALVDLPVEGLDG